jgi:uncharacterized protein YbjQ (UPF0145 family)
MELIKIKTIVEDGALASIGCKVGDLIISIGGQRVDGSNIGQIRKDQEHLKTVPIIYFDGSSFVDADISADRPLGVGIVGLNKQEVDQLLGSIVLTTEHSSNLKIKKRLDVITAECVFGLNIFKDLMNSVRDIVGGRSATVQHTLQDARRVVMTELKKEAFLMGANAVVAIDLDYSEFTGGAKSMLFVVASGTAVTLSEAQ